MMKQTTLLFTLLISVNANAQWSFDVFDKGSTSPLGEVQFPVTYRHTQCDFSFTVWNGSGFDDVTINNLTGCDSNDHYLVIDDRAYVMPDGFIFAFGDDQWTSANPVNLGACTTVSATPIATGSPNLLLGGQSFQINTTERLTIRSIGDYTFFIFKSMNGDITCTNGVDFIALIDPIFVGDFE